MAYSNNTENEPVAWWTQEKVMNWKTGNSFDQVSKSIAQLSVDSGASMSTPRQSISEDTSLVRQVSKELMLQRKEERLKKLEEKLELEKEMLSIGRDQLNKDIQRHQMLMQAAIIDLNDQVALERKRFIEEMAKEMERFKLPSIKRLMQNETEKVKGLIASANKVYEEGCDTVVRNVETNEKMEG